MRRQLQTLAAITAFAIPLAFAGIAYACYINTACSTDGQWVVGLPDESWADGMTAKFDFHLDRTGDELFMTRGQSHAAPADATFVFVTYSTNDEQTAAYRPEGCVAPTTTTVAATTTLAPPTTAAPTTTVGATTSSVAVVTLGTPPPVALLAVDIPPVPQPQGVSAAEGGQTLPATGANTLFELIFAVELITLGILLVRRTARP